MSDAAARAKIEAQLREAIVHKLELPPEKVTLSASFREDLGIDSLDVVELMFEVENRFDVVIPDTDLVRLATVGDLVEYLANYTKSA